MTLSNDAAGHSTLHPHLAAVDIFGDGMAAAPAAMRWASAALQLGGIKLIVALPWWRVRAPSSRPRRPQIRPG